MKLRQTMKQYKIDYESKYKKILADSFVDPNEDVPTPPIAISFGSSYGFDSIPAVVASYGNFSFVQAPPKSKKTFFLSLIAISYICGDTKYTKGLQSHRKGKKLIHYDTEQSRYHSHKVFRRVSRVCQNTSEYLTYSLRQYTVEERLEFIDWHLNNTEEIGLVIIDGIADLIADSNDLKESTKVTQYFMKWTQELNIHIMTAIHSNWNSDKPTGHLGSFLEKKAETQIALDLCDENIATVSCMRSRGFPFEKFAFEVNLDGIPYILDDIPSNINDESFNKVKNAKKSKRS